MPLWSQEKTNVRLWANRLWWWSRVRIRRNGWSQREYERYFLHVHGRWNGRNGRHGRHAWGFLLKRRRKRWPKILVQDGLILLLYGIVFIVVLKYQSIVSSSYWYCSTSLLWEEMPIDISFCECISDEWYFDWVHWYFEHNQQFVDVVGSFQYFSGYKAVPLSNFHCLYASFRGSYRKFGHW